MKKILAVLLLLTLGLGVCAPAMADEAQFATTRAFLKLLDEAAVRYTCQGIDEDGDEHVIIRNPDQNVSYNVHLFFEADQEHTSIFAWNLITFDPADKLMVMLACNSLNYRYNYTCFYVDETDNTVTCSMNLIYRDDDVGLVNAEALGYLMGIIEDAWPTLQGYDR